MKKGLLLFCLLLFIAFGVFLVIFFKDNKDTVENIDNPNDVAYVNNVSKNALGQGSWTVDGKGV